MPLNKLVKSALKFLSSQNISIRKNLETHRKLISLTRRNFIRPFYKIWDHKITSNDYDIPVRIFSPTVVGHFPMILFFHGGGWSTGNIDSYDKVCTNLAQNTNHTVVSVDYRLAPEHPFPTGLEDCYAVAREVFCNKTSFNVKNEEITLMGDSAGGNLAAALSLMARDRGEFMPHRQILIYPCTHYDHSENSPFESVRQNGKDYLLTGKIIDDYIDLYKSNEEDIYNPYFSPLLADDFYNQPETLIITAELDPLRDEGEEFGKRLAEFKNRVEIHRIPKVIHGFFTLPPRFQCVRECYNYINDFLKK